MVEKLQQVGELSVSDLFPPSVPWNAVESARLADSIAPRVQQARGEIERLSAEPLTLPFWDYPSAVAWLREEKARESLAPAKSGSVPKIV